MNFSVSVWLSCLNLSVCSGIIEKARKLRDCGLKRVLLFVGKGSNLSKYKFFAPFKT